MKESQSKVQSLEGLWRIPNVEYNGKIGIYGLSKELLPSRTQEQHAKYLEKAMQKGDFYTGDMPLYHSIFTALYKQKDKPESKEARQFIEEQMEDYWLMTLTRFFYQPKGKDKIVHNYKTSEEYTLKENIIGPDRYIINADSSALEVVLGTGNIQEINKVYNWLCNGKAYIWRFNKKPENVVEVVAGFYAVGDRAVLYCKRGPVDSYPSLGVREISAEGTQKKLEESIKFEEEFRESVIYNEAFKMYTKIKNLERKFEELRGKK